MLSSKKFVIFAFGLTLFFSSCTDFYNRTYKYSEEVPVNPFSIKLAHVEYQSEGDATWLKVSIHIMNKSTRKATFDLGNVQVRSGDSKKIAAQNYVSQKMDFIEFQELMIPLRYKLSRNDLEQLLVLIVANQKIDDREVLTLFRLPKSN